MESESSGSTVLAHAVQSGAPEMVYITDTRQHLLIT